MIRSATSLSAAAQLEESFGFFPFAELVARALACLSVLVARFSSFLARAGGLLAACSTSWVARSNSCATLAGTARPVHAGFRRPARTRQRTLVQGSVVVVGGVTGGVVVVGGVIGGVVVVVAAAGVGAGPMNWPKAAGPWPTGTVATTVFVSVSRTETVPPMAKLQLTSVPQPFVT